ncbi:glutathione S-transferase family protein [Sorangium sp. So ce128]|uniref:glutathione S-transferase family protein n=1 Tax=Sorangium sp. So ce128 TaxID=3133281 RepID=UPI003F619C5E
MENIRSLVQARRGIPGVMKLYRLRYSPFARKVQMLLDLLGRPYELVEVPYDDRDELARVTGGYIYVPVLVGDDGRVTVESRRICELLLEDPAARRLTLDVLEGPVWAYADFCDGPLEDVLFRIASPRIRDAWERPGQRALYTLIKERKFGAGCIEQWERDTPALLERAKTLLAPTVRTLKRSPFLFGEAPSLADAALYGNLAMLFEADRALPGALAAELPGYISRLERLIPSR